MAHPRTKSREEGEVSRSSRPWGRLHTKGGLKLTPTVQVGCEYREKGRVCRDEQRVQWCGSNEHVHPESRLERKHKLGNREGYRWKSNIGPKIQRVLELKLQKKMNYKTFSSRRIKKG